MFSAIYALRHLFCADRLLRERIRKTRSTNRLSDVAALQQQLDSLEKGYDRVFIVANRLPVTCSKDANGHWKLQARLSAVAATTACSP